ncbi:MAG: hypothetical protein JSR73_18820 [Proteobacteria bacterium]|nr:hypothetical protein [Pseudomonadota bacterium]
MSHLTLRTPEFVLAAVATVAVLLLAIAPAIVATPGATLARAAAPAAAGIEWTASRHGQSA